MKITKEELEKDFDTYLEQCETEAIIIVDDGKDVAVLLGYEKYKALKEAELSIAYQEHAQDEREFGDFELWETTVGDGIEDTELPELKGSVLKYDDPLEPVALEDLDQES